MGKLRNIFLVLSVQTYLQALNLLSSPQPLSLQELEAIPRKLDMTWDKKEGVLHFETHGEEALFEIIFPFKELPQQFSEEEKKWFKEDSSGYRYTYHSLKNKFLQQGPKEGNLGSYTLADRRMIAHSHPKTDLDLSALAQFILDKRVIFYTGAGISAASGVPTMRDLEILLDFRKEENFIDWTKRALNEPKILIANIQTFHAACFNCDPTGAHQALSQLALLKKTQILTENLDHLHQKTGYMPCSLDAEFFRKQVDPHSLKMIDAVICIGLSRDDKGFLAWYKQHHPAGKLISIDLYQPSYLGDEDYWIQGDLQSLVPNLLNLVQNEFAIRL